MKDKDLVGWASRGVLIVLLRVGDKSMAQTIQGGV